MVDIHAYVERLVSLNAHPTNIGTYDFGTDRTNFNHFSQSTETRSNTIPEYSNSNSYARKYYMWLGKCVYLQN